MTWVWVASILLGQLAGTGVQEQGSPAQPEGDSQDRVEVGDSGLLDVRFRSVDIIIALEMLSEQTQRNIVSHEGVSGTVSMVLRKVTFEEALETLLAARNLTYIQRGNVTHILPAAETEAELVEPLEMRIFRLKYILPSDADNLIKPLLSTDGKTSKTADPQVGIASDAESAGGMDSANPDLLIVVDHLENLEHIAKAIAAIDVRPKQVLVEATILRTTLNEQNALGIDFNTLAGVDFRITGAVSTPAVTDITVGALPASRFNNTSIATRTDFNSLIPAGGLTFGIVKDHVAGFIRALEQITDVTILANPKLLTLNKQRGEVIVGRRDGYLTTTVTATAAVQTVEFLETGTRLIFRPFIMGDGYIRVEIHPEDSNGGLTAANLPFQETTEVTVNILLKDGHTILIGGLFRERTTVSTSQVPLIGNIPVIGKLFGVEQDQTIREEIIILLTVHVLDSPDEHAEAFEELAEQAERIRVGARRGLMGTGREQLAEARYRHALEHVRERELDKALSSVRLALHMNPRHIDAIRLHERLLRERTWRAEGSVNRSFLHDLLRRDAGLPPAPTHERPDVDALLRKAEASPKQDERDDDHNDD